VTRKRREGGSRSRETAFTHGRRILPLPLKTVSRGGPPAGRISRAGLPARVLRVTRLPSRPSDAHPRLHFPDPHLAIASDQARPTDRGRQCVPGIRRLSTSARNGRRARRAVFPGCRVDAPGTVRLARPTATHASAWGNPSTFLVVPSSRSGSWVDRYIVLYFKQLLDMLLLACQIDNPG
jgi:hypothetical protein